jgi:hypothetical protein
MNSQPLNWVGVATVAVWAALLWRTISRPNSLMEFGGVVVLVAFGVMMAWNVLAVGQRRNSHYRRVVHDQVRVVSVRSPVGVTRLTAGAA